MGMMHIWCSEQAWFCVEVFMPVALCVSSLCRGDTSGHERIPLSVHGLAKQREAGVLRLGAVQSFGDD